MPEGEIPTTPETPQGVDIQHTERLVRLEEGLKTRDTELSRQFDDLRTDVFKRLDEEVNGVRDQLSGVIDRLEKATPVTPEVPTPELPAEPTPPKVEVEVPKPQVRKVRRGGRKVTKHVK